MSRRDRRKRKKDIAAASAALLYNLLPALMTLPAEELFKRLVGFFEGNLNAYEDAPEPEFVTPEPSRN